MPRHNCILTESGLQLVRMELANREGEFGADDRRLRKLSITALAEKGGISYEWASRIAKQKPGITDTTIHVMFSELKLAPPVYGTHYIELVAAPRQPVLPVPLTQFVGRDAQIRALAKAMENPEVRLVTLIGIGGIGKTRLAIETAKRLAARWEGRVWFVSLEDLSDTDAMLTALTKTLNLPSRATTPPLKAIVENLAEVSCLLILDGFERLLANPLYSAEPNDSAVSPLGIVRFLLAHIPGLTCFTTSRQSLQIAGEHNFPVHSLLLPEQKATCATLSQCESVKLFAARAKAAAPGFAVTSENVEAIASLCTYLEGHPLALEIAASWANTLTPSEMLDKCQTQGLRIESQYKDLPVRHRSLWAVLSGSYDPASSELQTFFAALSVFRGGWTLPAAEALDNDAMRHLAELQSRSLVVTSEAVSGAPRRFRLLEPVREFAAAHLDAAHLAEASLRHRNFFLNFADQAHKHMNDVERAFYMDGLEADYQNLCQAIQFCLSESTGAEAGLQMTGQLLYFWEAHGHISTGRRFLNMALERADAQLASEARCLALNAAGVLATIQGDYVSASSFLRECLDIGRQIGNEQAIHDALGNLGSIAMMQSRYDEAYTQFNALLSRQLVSGQSKGNIAKTYINLAGAAMKRGDFTDARLRFESSLDLTRTLENKMLFAISCVDYAAFLREQEDYPTARAYLAKCLPIFHESDKNRRGVAYALEGFADLACREHQRERSVRLYAAAQALREADDIPLPPPDQEDQRRSLAEMEAEMGKDAYAAAFEDGYGLTVAQAVAAALHGANA